MSVRYTAVTSMDGPALEETDRNVERWREKIEVKLDNRQVFFLFFGSAVVACMLFVLGVMVGKRVEARGHVDRAQTATAADPLAALDRLEGSGALTFQTTLAGTEPTRDVDKTIAAIEKQHKAEAAAEKKAAKKDDKKADDKKAEVAKKDTEKKDTEKKADDKKTDDKKAEVAKKDLSVDKKSEDKKADKSEDKSDKKDRKKDDKGRFTLQLSSFQDKGEADAFMSTVKASGFSPYITEAEVDGKGTFYRVRVGSYHSLEAANDAKSELDKNLKKPATVMKL